MPWQHWRCTSSCCPSEAAGWSKLACWLFSLSSSLLCNPAETIWAAQTSAALVSACCRALLSLTSSFELCRRAWAFSQRLVCCDSRTCMQIQRRLAASEPWCPHEGQPPLVGRSRIACRHSASQSEPISTDTESEEGSPVARGAAPVPEQTLPGSAAPARTATQKWPGKQLVSRMRCRPTSHK